MAHRVTGAARIVAVLLIASALLFSLAMAWNTSGWPVLIAEAALFAATSITALRALLQGEFHFPWTAMVFFALCLWIGGQLFSGRSVYPFATLQTLLTFLSIACAFWSILQLFEGSRVLAAAHIFLVVTGSATAAFSIVSLLTSNGRVYWVIDTLDSWRPMGPFLNANHNAVFMELLLPLALWNAHGTSRSRYLHVAGAALMYSSVIAAGSRAGILLATLEILILPLYSALRRKPSGQTVIATGVLIMALLVGVVLSDWSTIIRRFQSSDLFQQRRELLSSTLAMIAEHPVGGWGLGTWAVVYPRFAVFEPRLAVYHAHDEWAEWMAEGGVPFVALLSALVIRAILLIQKFPWGLGVAAAAAHALVDFPFHVYPVLLGTFLVVALLEASWYVSQARPASPRASFPKLARERSVVCVQNK